MTATTPPANPPFTPYPTMTPGFLAMLERCAPFTMTGPVRQFALHNAVRYVSAVGISGAFVECGVWRGGASMMAALSFMDLGDTSRDIYLYDTFAGMTRPTEFDRRGTIPTDAKWAQLERGTHNEWCYAPVDDVRANMASTGYPADRIRFVQGPVERTIPGTLPGSIAILRLDTDFYESTIHEMRHLYPLLAPGGVLIVDDYGVWTGSKKAVDEHLSAIGDQLLLTALDAAAVIAVKPMNSRAQRPAA